MPSGQKRLRTRRRRGIFAPDRLMGPWRILPAFPEPFPCVSPGAKIQCCCLGDVRYLVDEGAVLSDILDSSSPYAADTKPGTTVVFAPGVYELGAPLTIGQDVSLVGAGREETVFQAGAEPTVLLQVAGGDVDFSMSGIYVKGVDGNSHNNSSALQIGTNSSPNTGEIVIEACRFSDFTKNSITVKGGAAAITGNLIDCKPYPGAAGNGIQIDMGAQAVITRNVINGYVSQAENWSACGVLVLLDGKITRIRDNRFTACGVGITKETYYDTERDNTYLDPGAGTDSAAGLEVTPVISDGASKVEVHAAVMDQAVERVLEAAQSGTAPVIEIVVDSGPAQRVEVLLPVSSLDALGGHESARLTVASGVATVTLDAAALSSVTEQSRGTKVTLAAAPVAAEDLNEKQQAAAGGAPVFELRLKSGGAAIPHFGEGSATVSIPHALPHGQQPGGKSLWGRGRERLLLSGRAVGGGGGDHPGHVRRRLLTGGPVYPGTDHHLPLPVCEGLKESI